MKRSFFKIYRTTRLARYRVKSVFSKRAAYRLRTLQEAPDWRARGYNYGTILGHACVIPRDRRRVPSRSQMRNHRDEAHDRR